MPRRYPPEVRRQVVELARFGTKVAQLVTTFGMSEATIYNWLRQESIDRGEISGTSTDMALELAAAKTRIRQLETELAVSRKVNEVFLEQGLPPGGCTRALTLLTCRSIGNGIIPERSKRHDILTLAPEGT